MTQTATISGLPDALTSYCEFSEVWLTRGANGYPKSESGFLRLYHNRHGWHSEYVNINSPVETRATRAELLAVGKAMTTAFPNLDALDIFCTDHAEDLRNGYEYNLYFKGQLCYYWIRVNTTPNDHNMYIHAIVKEGGR